MGNLFLGMSQNLVLLETETAKSDLWNRIFGLDSQLTGDAVILMLAVLFLFALLSYLVFNPARDLLKKRQEKIKGEMDFAAKEKEDALFMKAEYDKKLHLAEAEAEAIVSEGRKKALKRENDIIEEAGKEAKRIRERAEKENELERNRMQDSFKQELVAVAAVMTEKMIAATIDEAKQAALVEEALNEMGDDTWRK